MSVQQDGCYRWGCDFAVAHAVFACGFVTAPVAALHLVRRPRSAHAIFFAVVAAFFTAVSLILCFRFYADLKRPPWPRHRRGDLRRTRQIKTSSRSRRFRSAHSPPRAAVLPTSPPSDHTDQVTIPCFPFSPLPLIDPVLPKLV
uniref:Uncharacterized protein n=1 Tax=Oryza brachyantha TaxID=4533 RepID=J3LBC2_ORYBR